MAAASAWERGHSAERVEEARAAAAASDEQLRQEVAAEVESLDQTLASLEPLTSPDDAATGGDGPEDTAAGLDPEVEAAVVAELDRAVQTAEDLVATPVDLQTRAEVVEGVRIEVPVAAVPSAADLQAAQESLATATAAVQTAQAELAATRSTSALAAARDRLQQWEPIAADPASLDGLRAAIAEVELAGPSGDPTTLGSLTRELEAATAAHPEVVSDGVGPTAIDGIPVVNKAIPLPAAYDPGLLPEVAAAFEELRAAAAAEDGLTLWNASGYRSHSDQQQAYQGWVARAGGREGADRFSSRPGHSEHQSGLAVDVNDPSPAFGGTPEAEWVAANAHRFGFVVRYPEGKEGVTGYIHEPWHLRHVGTELAATLTDSGLSLEEHLGIRADYLTESS